jgi:predicted regulator of Ras-like GTPase activity (Roadblock/LC7/MglB family)
MNEANHIPDSKLRQDRLVFYAQDVLRMDGELDGFLELSGARCALVIDKEGHLVTRRGDAVQGSLESIAALVAGSFAATRELARLFGEQQFTTMVHQGERQSISVALVGERALFATVFDQGTNLGLVRFYGQQTQGRLAGILAELEARGPLEGGEGLAEDFGSSAKEALDRLF